MYRNCVLVQHAVLDASSDYVPMFSDALAEPPSDDVDDWGDTDFLNKAKLTIKGRITRTALILLGKDESEHFLDSSVKIRWNLKTLDNHDKDFEIFSPAGVVIQPWANIFWGRGSPADISIVGQ